LAGSRYVFCIEDVWSVRPANKARVIWVRHLRKRKPENSTLIACARPGTGKVRFRRNRRCTGRKLHMPLRRAKDEAQQQQCVEWRSYGSSGARSAANPRNLRSAPGSFGDPPDVMLTAPHKSWIREESLRSSCSENPSCGKTGDATQLLFV